MTRAPFQDKDSAVSPKSLIHLLEARASRDLPPWGGNGTLTATPAWGPGVFFPLQLPGNQLLALPAAQQMGEASSNANERQVSGE